ncbi:MAG: TRAP transporter small permease [Gammaproteobacteria bacterium]|nr:MAG: TRAP transporter small permease [Gammaproteobacteria bacterium]
MRLFLDKLYSSCGIIAGAFILLITLLILTQIIARWFDVVIPSVEDFSGYFLAASSFFALSYTFKAGGHIRLTLLINRTQGTTKKTLTIIAMLVIISAVSFATFYGAIFVYESFIYDEISQGYIPIALWIPQSSMLIGVVVFLIALVDDLVMILQGIEPNFIEEES